MLSFFCLILFRVCRSDVLNPIGRFYLEYIGDIGEYNTGAESIAIDTDNNRFFTADGTNIAVDVLSYTLSSDFTSSNITLEESIHFDIPFIQATPDRNITLVDVTSVQYSNGYVFATLVPDDFAINNGWLAFVETMDLSVVHLLELDSCYLPDHISITNDNSTVIIACEGEPNDNEVQYPSDNPPGSVAIVDISSGNVDDWTVHSVNFDYFDNVELDDIYRTHQDELFSINVEPEYSAISDDNKYAYMSLQEQNAIAVLDIDAKEIIGIYSLGFTNFSVYGLDASDMDGKINIKTYPNLYGMRAPDSIDYLLSDDNRHYLFTANEGDTKDFDEVRVSQIKLSNVTFGDYNVSELQKDENLGRLKVSNLYGKNDLNEYETLYAFSSRDFTIWEVVFDDDVPANIELIYSSGNVFETVTADVLGMDGFNSDYFHPSFDARSDDKGPEPESIVVGKCNNGRKYAFIGMERVGGIFVFDISLIDEGNIEYVEYFNSQNYSVQWIEDTRPPRQAGDIGVEQLRFIHESVYGIPLLVAAYPESSSVAMYSIDCGEALTSDNDSEKTFKYGGVVVAVIVVLLFVLIVVHAFFYEKKERIGTHRELIY